MVHRKLISYFFMLMFLTLVMLLVVGCKKDEKITISFTEPSYSIKVGEDLTIIPEVKKGKKSINQELVFLSLDEKIAKVDENGKVTGLAVGDAKIRVSIKDNDDIYNEVEINVLAADATQYIVTFYNEDNKQEVIVEENKTVAMPPEPTKEGFVFVGWYLGILKYNFNSPVTRNITLVAKFEKELEKFTVTFNNEGKISSSEVEEGKRASEPLKPTKDGHVFIGWYLDDQLFNFNNLITKNITLVAKFEEAFNIVYHLDGGVNDEDNPDIYYRSILPLILEKPTKDNHRFLGWYDNADFAGEKITNIPVDKTGSINLYAKFEVVVISDLTYHLNGGSFSKNDLAVLFLTDFYNFLNPDEDLNTFMHGIGKTSGFDGTWHEMDHIMKLHDSVNKGINPSTGMFINQAEYNVKWMPFFEMLDEFTQIVNPIQSFWNLEWEGRHRIRQYIMHVRPGGEETEEDMEMLPAFSQPMVFAIDNTADYTLPILVRDNYTFDGWYEQADFSGEVLISIPKGVKTTKVLYAKWIPLESTQ